MSGKENNLTIFGRQVQTRYVHSRVHLFFQKILIKPLPCARHRLGARDAYKTVPALQSLMI